MVAGFVSERRPASNRNRWPACVGFRARRDVSADAAIRLGRYFGTGAQFWLNLQSAHAPSKAERDDDYSMILPRDAVA
jgi:hypothetical protein